MDHFKKLNDNWGHEAGYNALKSPVAAMFFAVRQTDIIARIGGNEFAILMPECPFDKASLVTERIRTAIVETMQLWDVTPSIGALTCNTLPHHKRDDGTFQSCCGA